MGEIADSLLNGDFDFYTGEYLGPGFGMPRTGNRSLPWEKNKKRTSKISDKESAYNGIKKYISQKWSGRQDTPSVRSLVYEYIGETNVDLKQKCFEIQKDFKAFIKFIDLKLKA